jgi:hypothetical protein
MKETLEEAAIRLTSDEKDIAKRLEAVYYITKGAKWQQEQDKSTDGEWLSPVPTERAWQEEKLVEIFGHYPTASPKWQYMNGLIQNSLDAKQMYSEEELRNAMNWMLTQYFEFHEWPAMGRVNHYIETIKQQEQ